VSRNQKLAAAGTFQYASLEGSEAASAIAEPFSAGLRRVGNRHGAEEFAAGPVEIVEMLIVTEEDGIDPADLLDRQRRPRGLFEPDRGLPVESRRIEGRVGEQAKAAIFDKYGRAAYQGQDKITFGHLNHLAARWPRGRLLSDPRKFAIFYR
jgi:hypothetical protein